MRIIVFILFLSLPFIYVKAQTVHIISDTTWKGRNTSPGAGWLSPGFSDVSWSRTTAPNPENVIPVVPGSLSMWQRPNRDSAFMRKTFTIPVGDSYSGTMLINSDNAFYVYFNGIYAGSGLDWYAGPYSFTITPSLTGCSENVIAIIAANYGGPFGCSLVSDIYVVNPLNTPVTIAATSIDCSSFIARWDTVPTATAYYLDVSTDSNFSTFLSGFNNRSMGMDTFCSVSGLSTGGTYYYRVRCTRGLLTSCNSNVTRVTTVSLSTTNVNLAICTDDSVFLARAWRNTAGVYRDTIRLSSGCDSVINTTLTVYPVFRVSRSIVICDNDSVRIGGIWRHVAGTYSETDLSIHGCDSLVDFTVSTLPTRFTRTVYICNGDRYFAGGSWQVSAGIYYDSSVASSGCDSILATTLILKNISNTTRNVNICNGDSYFVGGSWRTSTGSYFDTLINYLSCDSIVNTLLNVLPNSSFVRNVSICSGASYFAGGAFRTISGTYYDTLINYVGCDSLLQSNLIVLPISTFTDYISICNGDSIYAGGAYQKISGSYYDTLINYRGCDSILRSDLTILNASNSHVNREICLGDSLYIGGAFHNVSGDYYDTLTNYAGCDSVLTTTLSVNFPVNNLRIVNMCEGGSFFAGGNFQTLTGIYFDTLVNYKGCDSTLVTDLRFLALSDTSYGQMDICESDTLYGNVYSKDTFFVYHFNNTNGCDSIHVDSLHFHFNPIVNAGADQYIIPGESAILTATGAIRYVWSNGDQIYAIKVSPLVNTMYIVIGEDSNACTDEDSVMVFVKETPHSLIVPTGFSPNGDGVNDVFRVLNYYDFTIREFNIYNRWGQVVYNGSMNSMSGWDGIFNSREQPIGTYTYYISAISTRTGKPVTGSGNLTMMR